MSQIDWQVQVALDQSGDAVVLISKMRRIPSEQFLQAVGQIKTEIDS